MELLRLNSSVYLKTLPITNVYTIRIRWSYITTSIILISAYTKVLKFNKGITFLNNFILKTYFSLISKRWASTKVSFLPLILNFTANDTSAETSTKVRTKFRASWDIPVDVPKNRNCADITRPWKRLGIDTSFINAKRAITNFRFTA